MSRLTAIDSDKRVPMQAKSMVYAEATAPHGSLCLGCGFPLPPVCAMPFCSRLCQDTYARWSNEESRLLPRR